jgi:hypothetical protein
VTRGHQIGIALAAVVLIYLLTPSAPRQVMTNAPGLSAAFNPISGQIALAAAIPPRRGGLSVLLDGEPSITVRKSRRCLQNIILQLKGMVKKSTILVSSTALISYLPSVLYPRIRGRLQSGMGWT